MDKVEVPKGWKLLSHYCAIYTKIKFDNSPQEAAMTFWLRDNKLPILGIYVDGQNRIIANLKTVTPESFNLFEELAMEALHNYSEESALLFQEKHHGPQFLNELVGIDLSYTDREEMWKDISGGKLLSWSSGFPSLNNFQIKDLVCSVVHVLSKPKLRK